MKVMVSVGTHEQPFQRLLDAVATAIAEGPAHEWVVQFGVGRWQVRGTGVRSAPYLDAVEMRSTLEWADVLVSQASPGNAFGALAAGTWPLVLGRSHADGEHVDDHQVRFAAALETMGYATDLRDPDRLLRELCVESRRSPTERATAIARASGTAAQSQAHFRSDVWTVLGVSV